MAEQNNDRILGVDVSSQWLDGYEAWSGQRYRVANSSAAISTWLQGLGAPVQLAVEATGSYHETLVQSACQAGHTVYLVNALRVSRYREAVGTRVKTDRADALLLARYLAREGAQLRPYRAGDPRERQLWRLLKRRATVVKGMTQLRQSLGGAEGELATRVAAVLSSYQQLLRQLERELRRCAQELGWREELRRCQQLPGVGPLTALGLVAVYHRGEFTAADSFVAFIGLDVRVHESGRYRGRRKLSKQGDPEIRRLLYNAAMTACRHALWQPYYTALCARQLPSTAALMILARKLVRVCFALLRDQVDFDPARRLVTGIAT